MSESTSARRMEPCALPKNLNQETLGVAFFDLSLMSEWSSSNDDAHVAAFLQAFYQLAHERLDAAGARVVKFIGDARQRPHSDDQDNQQQPPSAHPPGFLADHLHRRGT